MADYEEEIPDEEKVKIASDFIMNAPPGEFNEVFNDVRVLLNNDSLLKDGAAAAFAEYNMQQFIPCKLEGSSEEVLITKAGEQPDGRFVDPRSQQVFTFDHLRKEASGAEGAENDGGVEGMRSAFDSAVASYTKNHYPAGVSTVYGAGKEVIVCIEDHKFQPRNFWNGRWRSQWNYNTGSGSATGVFQVQVHYYEDGNVQLRSKKSVTLKIPAGDPDDTGKKFVAAIEKAESAYQRAISENYNAMSDTTFKALRRALPVTRSKVDWNKIMNYKVGKELHN